MDAWTFDADNIDIRDITPDNIYQYVVRTRAVESFLKHGAEDRKYFVVAPKGLGKTFLLKVKSKFYRATTSGYKCIPSDAELVEKLTSTRVSFSKEQLGKFKQIETWEKTWELSLLIMILRNFNIELPPDLKNTIGEARTLLDILGAFLSTRNAIDRLYSLYVATFLRPKVDNLRTQGANQIAIFIDNIDEGLEKHGYQVNTTSGTLSEDVWINAQLGMMKIVRDICTRYKHIKIFASIRSEAFNNLEAPTRLQYQDISSILRYSKKQIKEIFEQNIGITKSELLAKPKAEDLIERFVGFSGMDHRFVKDGDKPRREDTFDFIFRHTFGRPREIVLMGGMIEEIAVDDRTADSKFVREIVNRVSGDDLLAQLATEIVPYFQEEAFDKFCHLVRSNVIPVNQAEEIINQISENYQIDNVFSYLYSIGLVGITEFDLARDELVQKFLPVGMYSLSRNPPPPASKYFVVHSAVDRKLRNIHGPHFYDKNNIIGNDLSFRERGDPKPDEDQSSTIDYLPKALHVHFGLGRDSLTLILPELNKSKSIAIIENPSKDERELAKAHFVEIRTGHYDPIRFRVVNASLNAERIDNAITQWQNGGNIIVYSDDAQLIGRVLNLSETVTLWSSNFLDTPRKEDLLPMNALNAVRSDTRKKMVYLCQRVINKKILQAIEHQIESKNLDEKVSVRTSLIDRLEYETTKFQEENTLVYDVKAEEYGSIICQRRTDSKNREDDSIVRRTKDIHEQRFYQDRQKYLKEGIYRLLKIIKTGAANIQIEDLDAMFDLFFDIQIGNLAKAHNLARIYPGKTQTQIVLALKEYCNRNRERFDKLTKIPAFIRPPVDYIRDSKKLNAFPADKVFFQMAKHSGVFTNSQVVLQLQKLLNTKPLKDYHSVFVCFSAKDESFAKKISDSLKKRGVDTYFFKDDHRPGDIKSVEKTEIAKRDKILVVVSENSMTSNECQQELTIGITKRQGKLSESVQGQQPNHVFVPIMIDDYIFSIDESTLEGRVTNSNQAWTNVQLIRQQSMTDFSEFHSAETNRDFESKVDSVIIPALKKIR
jgi:hypothetical protein